MTREMTFAIREKDEGKALSAFLAAGFHLSRGGRVDPADRRRGRVSVNSQAAAPDSPLRVGAVVRYDASGIPEPPVDTAVAVVLADPVLINRIDRETSGLVMIGKTPEAAHICEAVLLAQGDQALHRVRRGGVPRAARGERLAGSGPRLGDPQEAAAAAG